MKNATKFLIITCLFIFAISGCKKKILPDTTKPTITMSQPTAGQSFVPGSNIPFQATFSDNDILKSYSISISKVVTGGLTLKIIPTSVPFSYNKPLTNFNTGVKQQVISLTDITIPANTATTITTPGSYNFKVTCIDGANNSTETIVVININ